MILFGKTIIVEPELSPTSSREVRMVSDALYKPPAGITCYHLT